MATTSGRLLTVRLSGSPRERGRIHGETLRGAIARVMARWREALARDSGMTASDYVDRFLESTNFLPSIERWAPHLLEEVRGIAEGADVTFDEMYAYQLVDEQWIFTSKLKREAEVVGVDRCTALGVFDQPGQPPILAQNMDIPTYYDGSQTVLLLDSSRRGFVDCVWTIAGLIGGMGVNGHGVGVCCNTVSQLRSSTDGLPVAFIVRRILEHETRSGAVSFVRSVRHASGENYTIGGPDGITSLECSASQYLKYTPLPTRVFHTNHPLVNDELEHRDGSGGPNEEGQEARPKTNSEMRFDAISTALGTPDGPVTVQDVMALLADPESLVCVTRDGPTASFTASSMVAELGPHPVVHLAPGPPDTTPYETFDLGSPPAT